MARKRRGRGEGAIFQRGDGQWCGRISLGYGEDGRRRQRTVYGQSKAEVQEKLRQLTNDASSGRIGDAGAITVSEYLARWLEGTARPRIAPKTALRYEQLIRLRINPLIGGAKLSKLAPLHVEQMMGQLEKQGVSPRGRQMALTMLTTAMRDAVRLRLIGFNPASEIARPKVARTEMHVLDQEQAQRFLAEAEKDRLGAMYFLALDSAMRQGELFGLLWQDVDFDAGAVIVRRSLQEINGHCTLKEPKTARSRRRIPLSPTTLAILADHRKGMLAEGNYRPDGPVFCDLQGGFLRKGNVLRRSYWPILDRAKLPRVRFHDLRHSAATLLLAAGVNVKIVGERLGHASVVLTLDTYSHVLPSMQEHAARTMEGILGARKASGGD